MAVGHFGNHFGGVSPVDDLLAFRVNGEGNQGNYATTPAASVLEGQFFGKNGTVQGTYRPVNRLWVVVGAPTFGNLGNPTDPDAIIPPANQILNTSSSRVGGVTTQGTYDPGAPAPSTSNKRKTTIMLFNQPAAALAALNLTSGTPAKLFASRDAGNAGWSCANNTGQPLYFLECRSGETPNAAMVQAAGRKVPDGDVAEGGSSVGDVFVLAAAGAATVYPQQRSKAV